MKVALVYDRVNKWGGAERVLLALCKLFPEAPIFTSVYDPNNAVWAENIRIIPSFLQKIPYARSHHEILAPLMPVAFEGFDLSDFDVVISVTSEAAKGIITSPRTIHICICLTPTRYLWSGYLAYFGNFVTRFLYSPIISYLKMWDVVAAQRPDYFVAISENVRARIAKYYFRNSTVIYPPLTLRSVKTVDSSQLTVHSSKINKKDTSSYFLVVSRLSKFTMYKRVDLAIKVANKLKIPLKIIGEGRDMEYFADTAGNTVEFIGRVTDEELSQYYNGARALIFPGEEDFGLVMVEAQAHGLPVIAYRSGGAVEIIIEGKTGIFFDRQSVNSLTNAIEEFAHRRFKKEACIKNSRRFSHKAFEKNILSFLAKTIEDKNPLL